ncbi:MAG: InlB B-repeat-containing protein [Bacteroidales bacterium]
MWAGSSSTQSFNQVVGSTKSISDPTRAGYTFTGWSKSLGNAASFTGTTFTFGAANTSSSLSATWTAARIDIEYYVDGSATPCYTEDATAGVPYTPARDANTKATKPDCNGLDGWYTDAACTKPYTPKILTTPTKLYARNKVVVRFGYADHSIKPEIDKKYYSRKTEDNAYLVERALDLPGIINTYWGQSCTLPALGTTEVYAWELGANNTWRWRTFKKTAYYEASQGSGKTTLNLTNITANKTLYVDWTRSAVDGSEDT